MFRTDAQLVWLCNRMPVTQRVSGCTTGEFLLSGCVTGQMSCCVTGKNSHLHIPHK